MLTKVKCDSMAVGTCRRSRGYYVTCCCHGNMQLGKMITWRKSLVKVKHTQLCTISPFSQTTKHLKQVKKNPFGHDSDLCIIIFRSNTSNARTKRRRRDRFSSLQSRHTQWAPPAAAVALPPQAKVTTSEQWERLTFTHAHKKEKKKSPEQLLFFSSEKSFAGERGQRSTQSEGALENQSGSNCL